MKIKINYDFPAYTETWVKPETSASKVQSNNQYRQESFAWFERFQSPPLLIFVGPLPDWLTDSLVSAFICSWLFWLSVRFIITASTLYAISNSLNGQLDLVFVLDPSELMVSWIDALVVQEDRYHPTLEWTI